MAKKAIAEETIEVAPQKTVKAKTVKEMPPKPKWEMKDRIYRLKNGKTPVTATIKSRNLYWFDEEKGYEREIKYAENQKTPFVDEMKGDQRLAHIIFRNGSLFVQKEKTILQKLLSIYHPHREKLFTQN